MLDTELGYNLFQNDSQGSKSDETLNKRLHDISLARVRDEICRVYRTVNNVSVCFYFSFRDENVKTMTIRSINQYNFHKVQHTGSASLTIMNCIAVYHSIHVAV